MIGSASGYLDPDEAFQLEKEEDQDVEEEELEPEANESEVIQVGQFTSRRTNRDPSWSCLMMNQWLQEQEVKLQQMNQL